MIYKKFLCVILFTTLSCGVESEQVSEQVETSLCAPQEAELSTVSDLVFFLNSLDKPLSLNCAVGSLPNNFGLSATESKISVQPAHDRFQSRIFLVFDESLYLSIVPGENLLEIGEVYSETLTIKAEINFPLEDEATVAMPFRNVSDELIGRKKCGAVCHDESVEVDSFGGVSVYASTTIRPNPSELISLDEMKSLFDQNCLESSSPCDSYEAVFKHDDIHSFDFPEHLPFF